MKWWEEKIPKPDGGHYKVDGYFETGSQKYVTEFSGCLFHGCPLCYKHDQVCPHMNQSMKDLYNRTLKKKQALVNLGYNHISIWEHEFQSMVGDKPELKTFVSTLDVQKRLDPRESFFGGRCNAVKLYAKAEGPEKIKYVGFTSLYPTVNKYDEYPVGHPKIIFNNFEDIGNYFGMAKVKILPHSFSFMLGLRIMCFISN